MKLHLLEKNTELNWGYEEVLTKDILFIKKDEDFGSYKYYLVLYFCSLDLLTWIKI